MQAQCTGPLAGKVALVIGGCQGIGLAISRQLSLDGCSHVFATTRDAQIAHHIVTASACTSASTHLTHCITPIVVQEDLQFGAVCGKVVKDLLAQVREAGESGGDPASLSLDLLVHSAGMTASKLLAKTDFANESEELERMFRLNTLHPLWWTKAAIREGGMLRAVTTENAAPAAATANGGGEVAVKKKKKGGSIVFIGSVVGTYGNAGQVYYSSSKASLHGAMRSIAAEYGPNNVRCNVVAPGLIPSTKMGSSVPTEQQQRWVSERQCLSREGTPEDVAVAVSSLVRCDFITGQVLHVDGGVKF